MTDSHGIYLFFGVSKMLLEAIFPVLELLLEHLEEDF